MNVAIQDESVVINIEIALKALRQMPLRTRGEVLTAVMESYAADKPSAAQKALIAIFSVGADNEH
jgi:hypothetical protein